MKETAPNATHDASNLMSHITCNAVFEAAFAAVVKSRELVRGLMLALDETFIGPIQKAVDFFGYRFNASDQRVQTYIASWKLWVRAGLSRPTFCTA